MTIDVLDADESAVLALEPSAMGACCLDVIFGAKPVRSDRPVRMLGSDGAAMAGVPAGGVVGSVSQDERYS